MRRSSLVVSVFVSLAAPMAGLAAYQSWSPSPAAVATPAQRAVAAEVAPTTKVRLRPCQAGTRLRHGVCVSHQVRTVVVPVAPAPALPTSGPTSGPESSEPDDDWQTADDEADEPTESPDQGDQDDDADEAQPTCAPHHQGTNDRGCGDDDTADDQEQQETESGDENEGEHESDEGTGVGTGTDD